jgi:TRAP-type C4-dicarboxylate transport system permease small subunit
MAGSTRPRPALRGLALAENGLIALLLVATVGIILAQVFFRYVLSRPLWWSTEVATDLLIAIAFVGFAIGVRDNAHVALRLFEARLGMRGRRLARAIELLAISAVALAIGIGGAIYAYQQRDETSATGIPLWVTVLPLPVGGGLTAVHVIVELIALARGAPVPDPLGPDAAEPGTGQPPPVPAPAVPGGGG